MRLSQQLGTGDWSLARARTTARQAETSRRSLREVLRILFGRDPELRKRAADVVRRVTEHAADPLAPFADELIGLLPSIDPAESRTRWHLGLVVARVALTREQRMRAAQVLFLLREDEGNVVRCSAIEGMALLATEEPSLLPTAEEWIAQALRGGTPAERARARAGRRLLERRLRQKAKPDRD